MEWKHAIEAIEQVDRERSEACWRAGDELCKGALDNGGLRACAKELRQRGHPTPVGKLRKWRDTATAFPLTQRRSDISFDVHAVAGDPEMLERILSELQKLKWPVSLIRASWVAAVLRGDQQAARRIYQDIYREDQRAARRTRRDPDFAWIRDPVPPPPVGRG
jgi:hypothetical protein